MKSVYFYPHVCSFYCQASFPSFHMQLYVLEHGRSQIFDKECAHFKTKIVDTRIWCKALQNTLFIKLLLWNGRCYRIKLSSRVYWKNIHWINLTVLLEIVLQGAVKVVQNLLLRKCKPPNLYHFLKIRFWTVFKGPCKTRYIQWFSIS